jgi:hypothetical protein
MSRYFNELSSSDYLEHFGVLGMHWGVRKSFNRLSRSIKRNHRNKQEISKIKKSRKQAYKNRYLLSDDDLNKYAMRYAKEKQFKDLSNEDLKPVRTLVKNVLTNEGQKAVSTVIQTKVRDAVGGK